MILDGYWKSEIKKLIRKLNFWSKRANCLYTEHQVNKAILYSAIVVRKMLEDELWAMKEIQNASIPLPDFKLLDYRIQVTKYPFSGDKDYIAERVIPDNYKDGNETLDIETKIICNSIIHSFVWNLAYSGDNLLGFLISSDYDKIKVLYLVSIDEWIKYLRYVFENCNV